ncbi:hypothetical protein BHE74_00020620 [Ensete ventricosum]|nr:hypothetical protein BHE74_00020620 [Ensete ventricosum]RZS05849.1 hypothetical protein BHM03_00036399 [Ensete ventricosum]
MIGPIMANPSISKHDTSLTAMSLGHIKVFLGRTYVRCRPHLDKDNQKSRCTDRLTIRLTANGERLTARLNGRNIIRGPRRRPKVGTKLSHHWTIEVSLHTQTISPD